MASYRVTRALTSRIVKDSTTRAAARWQSTLPRAGKPLASRIGKDKDAGVRFSSLAPAEQETMEVFTTRAEEWLAAVDGRADVQAVDPARLQLFRNDGFSPPVLSYASLAESPDAHERLLKTVLDPGCVVVDGLPDDPDCKGSVFDAFMLEYFGGLQTGQSVDGAPGLLLGFHCALGEGHTAISDGFAVAYALRERHPEHFDTLSRYGMDAGSPRLEDCKRGAYSDTASPIFCTDAAGNLARIQHQETYRTPLTVPFDDVPTYYAAYSKWYEMVHSDEFMTPMRLQQGQAVIFNNWRVMHGRAGLADTRRVILGGTVARDAFHSTARLLLAK